MSTPNEIVFDTETTGLDPKEDRLVELAGVTSGRSSEIEFTTLVDPQRSIPPEVRAIHHITPEDVVGAPYEQEAFSSFLETLRVEDGPLVLIAHNAKFDAGFITRIAPVLDVYYVDTLKLSYLAFEDAPAYGNQVLRYYLDLQVTVPPDLFPHRALYDCIVTRALYQRLREVFTLKEMIHKSANPVLLPRVTFGKHKGQKWSDVPFGYLKWCCGQSDMNEDVLHTAAHYMRGGR